MTSNHHLHHKYHLIQQLHEPVPVPLVNVLLTLVQLGGHTRGLEAPGPLAYYVAYAAPPRPAAHLCLCLSSMYFSRWYSLADIQVTVCEESKRCEERM